MKLTSDPSSQRFSAGVTPSTSVTISIHSGLWSAVITAPFKTTAGVASGNTGSTDIIFSQSFTFNRVLRGLNIVINKWLTPGPNTTCTFFFKTYRKIQSLHISSKPFQAQIFHWNMMVNFELSKEIKKDVFCLVMSIGQRKNSKSWWGIEPQTFGFCAPMLYHWATETPQWGRSITDFFHCFKGVFPIEVYLNRLRWYVNWPPWRLLKTNILHISPSLWQRACPDKQLMLKTSA